MRKPVLGRGLGNLLGETKIASKPATPAAEPAAPAQPELSNGLEALLRAGKAQGPSTATDAPSARTGVGETAPGGAPFKVPRWPLFVADAFLVVLATLLVFRSPHPLRPWEMALCIAAVVLGAALGCMALLAKDKSK